jgi:NAD-dependent deacetylase
LTPFQAANSINRLSGLAANAQTDLARARDWLTASRSIAVLTGAGISAESGVPTFRGAGGLWRNFRPEELATPEAFARAPRLVWEWYDWRRSTIARAEPNAGHRAIVTLESRTDDFRLITQNVDGLHDRVGSRRITKLHGDIWILRCIACGREVRDERVPLDPLPPRCECGGLMRPGVVWFGELLSAYAMNAASAAAQSCEVFLVVGTSSVVYPANTLPRLAQQNGARVIEVNFEPTELSAVADISLRGKSGELLPQLVGSTK